MHEATVIADGDLHVHVGTVDLEGHHCTFAVDPGPPRTGLRGERLGQPGDGLGGEATSGTPSDVGARTTNEREPAVESKLETGVVRTERVGPGETQQASTDLGRPDEADTRTQDLYGVETEPTTGELDLAGHGQFHCGVQRHAGRQCAREESPRRRGEAGERRRIEHRCSSSRGSRPGPTTSTGRTVVPSAVEPWGRRPSSPSFRRSRHLRARSLFRATPTSAEGHFGPSTVVSGSFGRSSGGPTHRRP